MKRLRQGLISPSRRGRPDSHASSEAETKGLVAGKPPLTALCAQTCRDPAAMQSTMAMVQASTSCPNPQYVYVHMLCLAGQQSYMASELWPRSLLQVLASAYRHLLCRPT